MSRWVAVRLLSDFGAYRRGESVHVAPRTAELWRELGMAEIMAPHETAMLQAPERAVPPPARAREVRDG